MVRLAARGLAILALTGAVAVSTGWAQPPAGTDRIYYREKKDPDAPVKEVDGTLNPVPTGYQVVSGGKPVATVGPTEIVRVVPVDAPGVDRTTMLEPVKDEVAKEWEKARAKYVAIRDKVKTANPPDRVRRALDLRVAYTTARAADDTPVDAGWKEKAEAAATLLGDFLSDHPGGWEVWPATRTLARLQGEQGKYQDAARTWAKAAKTADLPAELKQEAAFQEADALIRARRHSDAAARVAEALPAAPPGPAKDKLTILGIAAKVGETSPLDGIAPIEAEIAKSKDPGVRAVGYAMLGELYLEAKKPREAMWSVLWVEVVYNQNRDEVAKALVRLTELFHLQGEEDRARSYQERLRRYRDQL
jgi:hypothetical protein